MKKFAVLFVCVILLSGCTLSKKQKKEIIRENSNSNINLSQMFKEEDIYEVKFKEDNKKLKHDVSAKITRVSLKSKNKKEEAKKIVKYLDKIIDDAYSEFKIAINDEYVKDSSYLFNYDYSLVSQNTKYIIFKLHFSSQIGGPYPIDADEYYMFHVNSGEIVEFKDLFTSDNVKNDVYNFILKYLNNLYKENDMEYNSEDYDLISSIFSPGYYVLNNGKLIFSLPRSYFTMAALGSITIDIDDDIYISYIK